MSYDFDKITERRGSGALKYDALGERYGNPDLLPLWVADMDFETPPFIIDALRRRLDHPILGYSVVPEEYWESIIRWTAERHNWHIRKEWISFVPGVVKAIGMIINVFTNPGDKVIIQPPVYHIFKMVIEGNGREAVDNPLIPDGNGLYAMDLDHLEKLAEKGDCKVLVLSNPHNPAGIVWDEETLRRVAEICHRHNILVISDEIHCDMVLRGFTHHPFALVSEEAAECCITLAAPSKTFNMPGVVSAYSIVSNEALRKKFYGWLDANELSEPTVFAPTATIAAYTQGEEWRKEMLDYVEKNLDYLSDFCQRNLPGITAVRPQASFLALLDCRATGLTHSELVNLFEKKAQLALNDGAMFGPGGEGFMRINVGTPRPILTQALTRLHHALESLPH